MARHNILRMLRKGTDGLWFVDHLRASHGEANDDDALLQADHRDAIADQIRRNCWFDRTGQKVA
jgi:hypothetical protein